MHSSLRTRILSLVVGIIILTTISLIYTVQRETRRSFHHIDNTNTGNLLKILVSAVKNEYSSVRFFREEQLKRRKIELKNMIMVAYDIVDAEYRHLLGGDQTAAEAKEHAISLLRHMRYDNGTGYFWINNCDRPIPRIVMHPTMPELEGTILDAPKYNCAMGTNENLLKAMLRVCDDDDAGYVDYLWPKPLPDGLSENRPKISYVRRFKPWNWIIGTGLYVDDIEETVKNRIEAIVKELRQMANELSIGPNGYIFIFSGKKEMLVHPVMGSTPSTFFTNPDTGKLILDEIKLMADSGGKYFDYRWLKPLSGTTTYFSKRVYCEYFAPLDWYICVSYYIDDMEKPIAELNQRLWLLALVMLVLALSAAIVISASLTAPLRRLTQAAENITRSGIDNAVIPVVGSSETRELGKILNRSIDFIRTKENELRASEENLKITLESIGDAVIATDTEGRITRMNPTAERIAAWLSVDARGKFLTDGITLIDPATAQPIDNPVAAVLSSGKPHPIPEQTTLITSGNRKIIIDGTCSPLRSRDGSLLGVVIAFHDITEKTHLEGELHQAQKMESLGQLAGGVAHDFNNMLAAIMSCTELLRRKQEDSSGKLGEYTGLIVSTCEKAADLTGKLLSFSRKGKTISSPIDVHHSIRDAIGILEHSLDKRITITSRLGAIHSVCVGDPSQIQNMIINLGINAGHAMPEGGKLIITTRNTRIDLDQNLKKTFQLHDGEYLEIDVEDTGTGIPENIIDRIFEPFFTTKSVGHGTGLGLAAVYGSVKEHHGGIKVRSEVGAGTTFSVYLPLCDVEAPPVPLAESDLTTVRHGVILLVDDEKIIRAATRAILEDMGYQVLTAENGQEAVETFRRHQDEIDLVITDMVMPVMNGEDCFYAIRQIKPDVKVLLSSGFSSEAKVEKMKQHGLLGMIRKPYRRATLAAMLRDILS